MNHGNLGVIAHNSEMKTLKLVLPVDLLRSLSIYERNIVEGVFYPGTLDRLDSNSIFGESEADFVLSPMPFSMWPRVGRVRIYLPHDSSTSITHFSSLLAKEKASIVHSEYSRSGHHFATWNLVIVFDIEINKSDFDKEMGAYREVVNRLNHLREKLSLFCEEGGAYSGRHFLYPKAAVLVEPLRALAYYSHIADVASYKYEDTWIFKHFSLECENDDLVPIDTRFPAVLGHICKKRHLDRMTCVYADVSTSELTVRVAIIPQEQEKCFANISVDFERTQPPNTSRGFCAKITQNIPENYKVWHLTNFTREFERYSETGGARLLVDTSPSLCTSSNIPCLSIDELLSDIRHTHYQDGFDVETKAESVDTEKICSSIIAERPMKYSGNEQYDVFLSYDSVDSAVAKTLQKQIEEADCTCFMSEKSLENEAGANFAAEIRRAIRDSREMIILCSPASKTSEWVTTEWGAAWVLEKRIVPVLYQLSVSDLPDRLSCLHCVNVHEFSKYLRGCVKRAPKRPGRNF